MQLIFSCFNKKKCYFISSEAYRSDTPKEEHFFLSQKELQSNLNSNERHCHSNIFLHFEISSMDIMIYHKSKD